MLYGRVLVKTCCGDLCSVHGPAEQRDGDVYVVLILFPSGQGYKCMTTRMYLYIVMSSVLVFIFNMDISEARESCDSTFNAHSWLLSKDFNVKDLLPK